MNKLYIILLLLLLPFSLFSQDKIMNTFILPYVIDNVDILIVDGIIYVKVAPAKAFGDKPSASYEELCEKFKQRLIDNGGRKKYLLIDSTLKGTLHYQYYLWYQPYIQVDYDICTGNKLYYLDYEDYINEHNTIMNFSERRTNKK